MLPKSLSATSLLNYLECPARFKAENIDKASQPSGSAAGLGTALHETIEELVKFCLEPDGTVTLTNFNWSTAKAFWDLAYWAVFSDANRYEEGVKILKAWIERQDWKGRKILALEEKKNFVIKTSAGDLTINYIMDRLDQLDDGSIEVIDYKSFIKPVQAGDLKGKIQVRLYALAAQMEHPDAPHIMVVFDLLRYDIVGVRFTKEENRATYGYLKKLAELIIADEPDPNDPKAIWPLENLNDSCQYCIRKHVCHELEKHATAGGTLAGDLDGPTAALEQYRLTCAIKALNMRIEDLDKLVLADMEAKEITSYDDIPGYKIEIGVSSRRGIDAERLSQIIGTEMIAKYGSIGVGAVDLILKNEDLSDDQKSRIKQAFNRTYGEPSIKVTAKPIV